MEKPQRSNIALIGFMGVGKTTCGRILSKRLLWSFLDTDNVIVKQTGLSIPNIFKQFGESYFRKLEKQLVAESLANCKNTVIATGGGMGADIENLTILRKYSVIVHLVSSEEQILKHLKKTTNRPLTQRDNTSDFLLELYKKRLPFYHTADVEISTLGRSINQIVHQIAKIIQ